MSHEWHDHPSLQGRFHPEHPDDVEVLVHDGGPRPTEQRPELVWVRITGLDGDVFTGDVLNQPQQLTLVCRGMSINFIAAGPHLLQVRETYLQERDDWTIHARDRCGLSALFDAPSQLMRKVFPSLPKGATMEMFTAFCGACGGAQVVEHKKKSEEDRTREVPASKKKWWQFWKGA